MVGDELNAVALLLFVGLILGERLLCITKPPKAVVALGGRIVEIAFCVGERLRLGAEGVKVLEEGRVVLHY